MWGSSIVHCSSVNVYSKWAKNGIKQLVLAHTFLVVQYLLTTLSPFPSADDTDSSGEDTAPNSEATPAIPAEEDDSDAPLVLKALPTSVTTES